MSGQEPLLDRALIEDAFRRLGDRLAARDVVAHVYVFGGAAMALAYDARRATRDIDRVFKPHGLVLDEARAVARELGCIVAGVGDREAEVRTCSVDLGRPPRLVVDAADDVVGVW